MALKALYDGKQQDYFHRHSLYTDNLNGHNPIADNNNKEYTTSHNKQSMFSKRHYKFIAALMLKTKPFRTASLSNREYSQRESLHVKIMIEFLNAFCEDSPKFNSDKFKKTCGY